MAKRGDIPLGCPQLSQRDEFADPGHADVTGQQVGVGLIKIFNRRSRHSEPDFEMEKVFWEIPRLDKTGRGRRR
jgi:hypothetical protein